MSLTNLAFFADIHGGSNRSQRLRVEARRIWRELTPYLVEQAAMLCRARAWAQRFDEAPVDLQLCLAPCASTIGLGTARGRAAWCSGVRPCWSLRLCRRR